MWNLSSSEMLFYGGIILMAAAAVIAMVCTVIFVCTGQRIKRQMEQEYGKPHQ